MAGDLPAVVSPAEAAEILAGGAALVVDFRKPEHYRLGHLPGALQLDYSALVRAAPPAGGLLPTAGEASALFASLGLCGDRPVLAYDDEGNGRAGRLVWTLHAFGHQAAAIVDGGFAAWCEAGLPAARDLPQPQAGDFEARPRDDVVAVREWILARLGDPDVVLVDTRSGAEYRGEDVRAARGGHIPGAVSFDWVRAMDASRHRCLRPREALLGELAGLGVTPDREVVAYCQTHHRSSHTYVMLRWLGFPRVRGYPGAWSDWGNDPGTPIAIGDTP